MRPVITLFTLLIVLVSCQNSNSDFDHETALESFKQMEGVWQLQPDTGNYESWSSNEVGMAGTTYSVSNGDTSVIQVNTVEIVDEELTYSATILMGALTETVDFKLTGQKKKKFIFENPEREFPKKITFTFNGEKNLSEVREGDISGMYQSMDIRYKRVE